MSKKDSCAFKNMHLFDSVTLCNSITSVLIALHNKTSKIGEKVAKYHTFYKYLIHQDVHLSSIAVHNVLYSSIAFKPHLRKLI